AWIGERSAWWGRGGGRELGGICNDRQPGIPRRTTMRDDDSDDTPVVLLRLPVIDSQLARGESASVSTGRAPPIHQDRPGGFLGRTARKIFLKQAVLQNFQVMQLFIDNEITPFYSCIS